MASEYSIDGYADLTSLTDLVSQHNAEHREPTFNLVEPFLEKEGKSLLSMVLRRAKDMQLDKVVPLDHGMRPRLLNMRKQFRKEEAELDILSRIKAEPAFKHQIRQARMKAHRHWFNRKEEIYDPIQRMKPDMAQRLRDYRLSELYPACADAFPEEVLTEEARNTSMTGANCSEPLSESVYSVVYSVELETNYLDAV